ncbi:MAG TPA: hypothetical protein PKG63_01845 [Bacteroidales bacterium]|jgi:REP element-mobilizing transposase RayT|nr:hypothetical protein [Bacteroidales bacterium]
MFSIQKYYHIYNHANGFENIFNEERNYYFFLEKYQFYISPIADTLAYCLMPNHFHLLIKIKSEEELRGLWSTSQKFADKGSRKTFEKFGVEKGEWNGFEKFEAEKSITKQFSKLFSCYTQSFNKVYNRRGSLFVPNYKRKEITSEDYLKQVFIYIHNNPVKHGFVKKPEQWNFSSYNAYIYDEEQFLKKNLILGYFDSVESLKTAHTENLYLSDDFIL